MIKDKTETNLIKTFEVKDLAIKTLNKNQQNI